MDITLLPWTWFPASIEIKPYKIQCSFSLKIFLFESIRFLFLMVWTKVILNHCKIVHMYVPVISMCLCIVLLCLHVCECIFMYVMAPMWKSEGKLRHCPSLVPHLKYCLWFGAHWMPCMYVDLWALEDACLTPFRLVILAPKFHKCSTTMPDFIWVLAIQIWVL